MHKLLVILFIIRLYARFNVLYQFCKIKFHISETVKSILFLSNQFACRPHYNKANIKMTPRDIGWLEV